VRPVLIVIGVLALVLASCATLPTTEDANNAVLTLREYESWAWAIGIALIWADLVLPIPQTVVIAALGIIYGTLLGGLLGSLGLVTAGLLGYLLMLTFARRFVRRVVGPRSLHKMQSLFDRGGAWAIILTRGLSHSVPETMVFLAGLAGMPMGRLIAALTIGSVPTAFVFAAIGAGWADQPIPAVVVSYVLPIFLLPIAFYLMRLRARQVRRQASSQPAPIALSATHRGGGADPGAARCGGGGGTAGRGGEHARDVKRAVIAAIISQFGHPRGAIGHVAGWVMAHRPSNRQRNRWVASRLDVQPTDRVLEIGFGPGLAIAELSRRIGPSGHVYGIDRSDVMLRQATRRNADAIRAGRVTLTLGTVEQLPPALDGPFDAIFAVNSLGHWTAPAERLDELRRRLRSGGRIAIASQPRCPGATRSTSLDAAGEITDSLQAAGFTQMRTEILDLDPPVVCVLATNSDAARDRSSPASDSTS
jgi:uncharacterized membrane protein YdjX (TVP38/TMEM64 family)/SAM-dependent methyltransferase